MEGSQLGGKKCVESAGCQLGEEDTTGDAFPGFAGGDVGDHFVFPEE